MYRKLVLLAVLVTLCLIPFGAWVRLTDAGLGCPDWPGCYGQLSPQHAIDDIQRAVTEQGGEHGPVSLGKAWREMAHRYVASGLGLLLLLIAAVAIARRRSLQQSPTLPLLILGVVVVQGLFGKWTVTLLLKPAIVTGHLIGGMTILALLTWLALRQFAAPAHRAPAGALAPGAARANPRGQQSSASLTLGMLLPWARVALGLLALQIVLGGWVSTNYAALACVDLPTCQGSFWPSMNFGDAFHVSRELGKTAVGEALPLDALTAIHWVHRLGAVVVSLALSALIVALLACGARRLAVALASALALQVAIGLGNVIYSLPLPLAVAHNAGAAVLLVVLVVLNFQAYSAARVP